jgi:hypothetical protein
MLMGHLEIFIGGIDDVTAWQNLVPKEDTRQLEEKVT